METIVVGDMYSQGSYNMSSPWICIFERLGHVNPLWCSCQSLVAQQCSWTTQKHWCLHDGPTDNHHGKLAPKTGLSIIRYDDVSFHADIGHLNSWMTLGFMRHCRLNQATEPLSSSIFSSTWGRWDSTKKAFFWMSSLTGPWSDGSPGVSLLEHVQPSDSW